MRHSTSARALTFAATAVAGLGAVPAALGAENGGGLAEALAVEPLEWQAGEVDINLGGSVGAAYFAATQSGGPGYPGGYDDTRASAVARANFGARRILDNGMIVGVRSDFLLYHDDQSGDNYDNDTVERLYVFVQTGFGRVELGQTDGAGYSLGLVGPTVTEDISLENTNISLFHNPVTGSDFADFFQSKTTAQSSSNFAKIAYVSPRLIGIQIGASFTPQTVRTPLPFTGNPSDAPDQQQNVWEVAANYTSTFSGTAVGLSAGYARGSLRNATAGGANLYDLAFGAQAARMVSNVRLSLGGAYRETNAYAFDTGAVLNGAETKALHVSTTAEWGAWRLGAEYSKGDVRGAIGYQIIGYQAGLAYRLNDNLELAAGWQWYDYARNAGTFYNGLSTIDMNAGFLTFVYGL